MALKSDRHEFDTDISFFMNETAERGVIVSVSTGGSGGAMDDSLALVTLKATSSGSFPVGVLLNDMVNVDLTRYHLNQHKDEVQIGGKVTIQNKGFVVTNKIFGTPSAGNVAYAYASGLISPTNEGGTVTGNNILAVPFISPVIGRFLSSKDEDGYAKVSINLP